MADWSDQLNSFLKSPLGQEVIRTLVEDLHHSLVDKAEAAETQEVAYGLLKQASGVTLSVQHLVSLAALSDEGSRVN